MWSDLRRHYKSDHSPHSFKEFTCKVCFKICKTPLTLKIHYKTHEEQKVQICAECGREFKSHLTLKYHLETHTKNRQRNFICKHCGKKYLSKKTHAKHYTEDTSYATTATIHLSTKATSQAHNQSQSQNSLFNLGINCCSYERRRIYHRFGKTLLRRNRQETQQVDDMGKKKNKNKPSGAVKTAAKTEKKLANKLKKELADLGEEDIAKVVAQIEREEAKRLAPKEKNLLGPPSPRAYATLTPHPTNNELILFGGEYHDGQKTQVYNELLFYNPSNNMWRRVKAPGAPPPRSAHQAVATSANKGELWIFGGEFTSLSESQFYHYKDLWCFSLAENKWEKVSAAGGPGARSGHRMALAGRRLLVFGGYTDDGRECRYFEDVHCFCLDTRAWTRLAPAGTGPSPRSACVMVPAGNDSVVIYGGFSRVREGRSERGVTHADLWRLAERAGGAGGAAGWQWRALGAGGGGAPPPRAQLAAALHAHQARAYVFGGVTDVEETEEELRGEMSDDLHVLELESGKWRRVALRVPPPPPPPPQPPSQPPPAGAAPAETITVITDEVFTMKLGGAPAAPAPAPAPAAPAAPAPPGPCARMSAMMAVQRSVLYVYGGVLEKDDKQFCLSDMYSLDLHKLSEWRTLVEQPPLPAWLGSDSDGGSWCSGSDSDSDHSDSSTDSEQ